MKTENWTIEIDVPLGNPTSSYTPLSSNASQAAPKFKWRFGIDWYWMRFVSGHTQDAMWHLLRANWNFWQAACDLRRVFARRVQI